MLKVFRSKMYQLNRSCIHLSLLIIFFTYSLNAQGTKNQYSIGKTIFIESDFLDESRPVIIHTPPSYNSSKRSYPVIYLIDGDVHFSHASGLVDYLAMSAMIPEMIVVAIPNIDRIFLDFLEFELLPYIDRKYRTQSFRIIFGHSLGGLFTLYTLNNRQQLFRAYFASSPYLMEHKSEIFPKTKELAVKLDSKNRYLYIALGNEPEYIPTVTEFVDLLEIHAPERLAWNYQFLQNENHGTVPPLAFYNGLRSLFSGWVIHNELYNQGFDAVFHHYEELSEWFGYPIPIPENIVNSMGYESLNSNDPITAIRIFQYNVERYPDSPNVYDSLAEAYRDNGELKKSLNFYQTAVKKAKKNSDQALPLFKENLKNIKKLIRQNRE
jgi:predicted alpha/beta superfamily hydrolase